jgi:hypothetical protein
VLAADALSPHEGCARPCPRGSLRRESPQELIQIHGQLEVVHRARSERTRDNPLQDLGDRSDLTVDLLEQRPDATVEPEALRSEGDGCDRQYDDRRRSGD